MAALLGAIIGWRGLLPNRWTSYIPKLSRGFLLLMLFALGARVGASPEVQAHLASLGFRALVISLATILGSVLVTAITAPLLRRRSFQSADTNADAAMAMSNLSQD
jgi:uncharacterized membrane protein YbjE (DUF340 family)